MPTNNNWSLIDIKSIDGKTPATTAERDALINLAYDTWKAQRNRGASRSGSENLKYRFITLDNLFQVL